MKKIRVIFWNEYVHEREETSVGDYIRKFYPDGIHGHLRKALAADDLELQTAVLDEPGQGLSAKLSTAPTCWSGGGIAHMTVWRTNWLTAFSYVSRLGWG